MALAKPGLAFATPAIGSGIGTSVKTTITPGQATQAGGLLVLMVTALGLPVVTLPVDWHLAIDASANGNTLQCWYKYNIAANEASFDVNFSTACRNTCFLNEHNKVLATSDPLVRTWSLAGLAQGIASFNTSPNSINELDLAVSGVFVTPNTAPTATTFQQTQFFHAEKADGQTNNGLINTTQGNISWWLGLTVGTGLRNYVQSFASTPPGQNYDVLAVLVEFAGAPGISPDTASASTAGQQAAAAFTASRAPAAAGCAITGFAPIVLASIPTGQAALVLTGAAASTRQNQTITPLVGAVAFAGVAPVLTQPVPTARNPVAGSLALTGAQSLTVTTKSPVVGFLVLTGLSPPLAMNILTGAGALSLTGSAAVFDKVITPGVGAFALTGISPVLIGGTVITPPAGNLDLPGTASTEAITITPAKASLVLAGVAANTVINNARVPGTGQLTLAPYAPVLKNDYRLTPFVGTLDLTGKVAVAIKGTVIAPNAAALAFGGVGAAVTNQQTIKPATGALNTAGTVQSVGRGIPPAGVALVLAGKPAATSQGIAVTPATATLALAGLVPFVVRGNVIRPASASGTLQGRVVMLSFGIIPRTGALELTPMPRNIAIAVVPKAAKAMHMQGHAPKIGRNSALYHLRLEER